MQLPTPTRRSGSHRVNVEPIRPVAAQVEEVVEVDKAEVLQLADHVAESTFGVNWTHCDKIPFDAELVGRETEPIIEERPRQPVLFERRASNQQRRLRVGQLNRHRSLKLSARMRHC